MESNELYVKREAIIDFSNEIIWNNSNFFVGNSTIFYKTWLQLGIKYINDLYDYSAKKFHSFEKLKELHSVPNEDFLRYLSFVQRIPKYLRKQLK